MFIKTKKIFIALIAVMFAAIAAVLCVNLTHKNSQSETAQAATNVVQVDGTTYTDFAKGWNTAVGKTSSASNRVTVKLLANVTATGGSFGTGAGFGTTGDSTTNSGNLLVPENKYITLDLNNNTLDRGLTSAAGYVIAVKGNLVLTDNSASKNGKITGGNDTSNGGGVSVYSGGTFTMNGGTISDNTARNGGGVYVNKDGTFTMSGGAISGNAATGNNNSFGGGVVVNFQNAIFTMSGGTISGNNATNQGGGVDNSYTFTMSGGEITGNSVTGADAVGGGINNRGTFKLSGSATVTGNSYNGASNNVYLGINKTIAISDGSAFTGEIGVTTKTMPTSDAPTVTLTSGWETSGSTGIITSDNPAYTVGLNGSEMVLKEKPPVVEVTSGSTATQHTDFAAGWQAAVDASTATVKLLDNVDTAALTVASGKKITLDLNGKTLDRGLKNATATSDGHVIAVQGNFELTDSSASKNGKITGGKTSSYGGGVYVAGGTFTMKGGTISDNTANYGGGVYVSENGTFTMSGGTISGNNATNQGGGVDVTNSSTFTMSGGTISGNTGTYGGGVYFANSCTFTMSGGTISGNTVTYYGGGVFVGGTFNLSGSSTVTGNKKGNDFNNVYLYSGKTITISSTFTGTVGVSSTGTIATGYTQADKPSAHFLPDNTANKCVYATDGTVTIAKEHSGNDDYNCTTAVKCKCGYVIKAAETAHSFGKYESDGASGHSRTCTHSGCTQKQTAAHTPETNDGYCTTEVKCTVCQAVVKEATAHDWGEYLADEGADTHTRTCKNCTATETAEHTPEENDGYCTTEVKCTVCQAVVKEATAHDWGEYLADEGADTHTRTCKNCTATETAEHTPEENNGYCTTEVKCSVCKAVVKEATEHDWNAFVADEGEDTHTRTCKNCTATETAEHSGNDDYNCTTAVKCKCGYVIKAAETAHSFGKYESDGASGHTRYCQNAGCSVISTGTHTGKDDGNCTTAVICSKCSYITKAAQTAHAYGEYTSDGASGHTHTCTREGCTQKETAEHTPEENDGYCTTEVKCTVCQAVVKAKTTHDWNAFVADEGEDTHTRTCKNCTATQMFGHTGGTATCIAKAKCVACGAEYGALAAHTLTRHAAVAATCTAEGSIEYWSCSICEKNFKDEGGAEEATEIATPIIEHKGEWITDKNPTCTEKGAKHIECTVCHTTLESGEIPVLGHAYGEWTVKTAATCTEEGVEERVCANDNTHTETRPVEALGHAYGEWTVKTAATCTEAGVEERVCANDNTHTETRPVEAKSHAYGEWTVKTAATCTEAGVEERVCANDSKHTETRPIAALGHAYGEWTVKTPATCTEAGVEERVCANDNTHTETRPVEALGHDWGEYLPVEGTNNHTRTCKNCTATETAEHTPEENNGYCTTEVKCTVCQAVVKEATAHDWNAFVSDDGVDTHTHTCNNCTATETVKHTPEINDGYCTTEVKCSVCQAVVKAATEHDWNAFVSAGESGHSRTCKKCTAKETVAHAPEEDDGNCTTALHCSVCGYEVVAAQTALVSVDDTQLYATLGDAVAAAVTGNTVKLLGNATLTQTVIVGEDITLDLNGYNITLSGGGAVLTVQKGLTLTDSGATEVYNEVTPNGATAPVALTTAGGMISGGTSGGVVVESGANFVMQSGRIAGNAAAGMGGGVLVNGGSFSMSGGEIAYNSGAFGGGVAVKGGQFIMLGGIIHDNTVGGIDGSFVGGAGVYIAEAHQSDKIVKGVLNITKGEIYKNSLLANSGAILYGGGVCLDGANSTATVSGGAIRDNTGDYGGGIAVSMGSLTVKGLANTVPQITGNKARAGGGVYLEYGEATVSAGSISGNKSVNGGGIMVFESDLIVKGGSVTGNTATVSDKTDTEGADHPSGMGGGIYTAKPNEGTGELHTFSVKLSGTAEISGNKSAKVVKTADEATAETTVETDNNLYLYAGVKITVEGEFTGKAGVTLAEDYGDNAFTAGYGAANPNAKPHTAFTSDAGRCVVLGENEARLAEHTVCAAHTACVVCGTECAEAAGHTLTRHDAVAATCTTEGSIEYWSCSICEKTFSDKDGTVEVTELATPVLAHKGGTATCKDKAKCEVCGAEYGELAAHTLTHHDAVAATCTAEGSIEYWSCSICEKTFSDKDGTVEVTELATPIIEHTAGDWIIDTQPTCTEEGAKHKECTVCNATLDSGEIPALGHTAGDWITDKEATSTEAGAKHKECTVCHTTLESEVIPATGETVEKVTVTVTGGSIDGAEGTTVEVDANGEITVVAPEIEGKTFKGWSADGGATILSANMRYKFSATKDMNLIAVYENAKPVEPEEPQKLSGGAIAGIVIGSVVIVLVALYITGLVLYKKKIIEWKICKVIYFFIK